MEAIAPLTVRQTSQSKEFLVRPLPIWPSQMERLIIGGIIVLCALAAGIYVLSPAADWLFYGSSRWLLAMLMTGWPLMTSLCFFSSAFRVARQSIRRDGDELAIVTPSEYRARTRRIRVAQVRDVRISDAPARGHRGYLALDLDGSFVPACIGWSREQLAAAERTVRQALRLIAPTVAAIPSELRATPLLLNYEPEEIRSTRSGDTITINFPPRRKASPAEICLWVFFAAVFVLPAAYFFITLRGVMVPIFGMIFIAGLAMTAILIREVYGSRVTITLTRSAVFGFIEFRSGSSRIKERSRDRIAGVTHKRRIASFASSDRNHPTMSVVTDSPEQAKQAADLMRAALAALSPDAR